MRKVKQTRGQLTHQRSLGSDYRSQVQSRTFWLQNLALCAFAKSLLSHDQIDFVVNSSAAHQNLQSYKEKDGHVTYLRQPNVIRNNAFYFHAFHVLPQL